MNRVLVDTNILVYSIDEDSKFHFTSKSLIQNPTFNLFTISKNLSEFLVVLTRAIEIPVSVADAFEILQSYMPHFTILYPSQRAVMKFRELLLKHIPKGLRIHDFEKMSIGLENGITKFATQNKQDFMGVEELS